MSVEISSSAVRMAEVVVGHEPPELVRLAQVGLPSRAVLDGVILDPAAVRVALERCIKEGGFATGDVHLGIVGLRSITREIGMPVVPDSEIDAAVRLQALDIVPFAIDKALISARPLEATTGESGMPERRVLVAAAHRDLVDPLIEVVTAAGLTPVSVEPTSSAMIKALFDPHKAIDGPEAIISIGESLTNVVVHEDGVPHFVRTIAEGGDAITEGIAGALGLPVPDAETTKRAIDASTPETNAALRAARAASGSLIAELRSSIDYYATLTSRSPVKRVVLTGGGGQLAGFAEQLQQQLHIPVRQGSSLSRVDCSRLRLPESELASYDPFVAVVVGLALEGPRDVKDLDLLPPEVVLGRKRRQIERTIALVAILIIIVMVGLGGLRFLKVRNAENQSASIQQNIAGLQAQIPRYNKVQQQSQTITDLTNLAAPVVSQEVYWPGVLTALADATPSGGVIGTFSGSSVTSTPQTVPAATEIASLNISLVAPTGYTYFRSWYYSVTNSGTLTVNAFSGLTQGSSKQVTFTSTVGVTAKITSIRINEFKVPS
jgi:type IV pilus assembly protein PilM